MSEYLRRIYFSKSEIHPYQCNVGLTIRPLPWSHWRCDSREALALAPL